MRPIEQSPFSPISPTAGPERLLGIWIVVFLLPQWGAWGALLMLVVAAAVGFLWFRHRLGFGPLAALLRLMRAEPWFFPDAVVRDARVATPEFAAACERAGVHVHAIDGRRIASWSDLARELAAVLPAPRFPSDPAANTFATLAAASTRPGPHMVVWRHTDATAAANAGLLVDFLTRFATWRHSYWHPLLVALDLPSAAIVKTDAPPAVTTASRPQPSDPGREAQWWQPRPGELTS